MKAEELRRKFKIFITGVTMAAMVTSMAACSSQSAQAGNSQEAAVETSADKAEDETTEVGLSGNRDEDEKTENTGNTDGAESTENTGNTGAAADDSEESAGSAVGQTAVSGDLQPGPAKEDIETTEAVENNEDSGHAIMADGEEASYSATSVTKTGDSDQGDEADFYGDNAAIIAANGGTLTLSNMAVETKGTHANAVFSYGEGTTVNISDSYIETSGNCSGGLMTTGGGTMNAENLTINTSGNSSAAIRSDRGGGTVTVTGGSYTTSGTGSPVIYSTADITVSNAKMESTASQGVVVEGKNSVTLNNVELTADNNTKNSDKSDYYQAVMIYQSMSGDADEGTASFTMNGGSLTNANGDIFFVNNTAAAIDLTDAEIINKGDGVFLRAAAAGWGSEGSNGGHVNMTAAEQEINGDMVVDDVSELNLYLKEGSVFTGAVNSDGAAGSVYVEIEEGSKWVLTGDSYITSLTCGADAIDLNGFTLHVGDQTYEEGTESSGQAVEFTLSSGNGEGSGAPDGMPGEKGENGDPAGKGGPGGNGSAPPEKPGGEKNGGKRSDGRHSQKNGSASGSTSTGDRSGSASGSTSTGGTSGSTSGSTSAGDTSGSTSGDTAEN